MPVMEMEGLKTSDYYFDLPKELIAQPMCFCICGQMTKSLKKNSINQMVYV